MSNEIRRLALRRNCECRDIVQRPGIMARSHQAAVKSPSGDASINIRAVKTRGGPYLWNQSEGSLMTGRAAREAAPRPYAGRFADLDETEPSGEALSLLQAEETIGHRSAPRRSLTASRPHRP